MIDKLEWNSLSYTYNQSDTISFPDGRINRGEVLAAIGPSGSGKSTWLQLLSGILAIQNGNVLYGETSLKDTSERRRDKLRAENVGLVFQNNHFLNDLSVADNLSLPAFAQKAPLDKSHVSDLASRLKVTNLLNKKPKECSVGELQRLSIVRTLSTKPSFILADEPTSALDDVNTASILSIFDELVTTLNIGVLIVTHDNRVKSHFSNTINFGK
ncbi:MAG: ATP-binding cassette domain-containing protein [Flavobacteriia bacterium]|nr:ATP-binding cassette domain-containing protein [Flavobacteriia bacterium]